MSVCGIVLHEIMWHEKRYGKKPKLLVLADPEFRDKFFADLFHYTMKTDSIDFKEPGRFYGVPFKWKNIGIYGGSCKWMLIGSDGDEDQTQMPCLRSE